MAKARKDKIESAIAFLTEKHHAEWTGKYGEPGYTNPEKGIILANWNDIPEGLADWLEKCGYELEWSDEWTIDYDYGKAYRVSPDSYSWESSVLITDNGEMLTPDDDASEWIDECANTDDGQPVRHCLPSRISDDELADAGFVLFKGRQETGLHAGQTDNPAEVAREAFEQGAARVVFRKTEQSQFYAKWECWAEFEPAQWDRFDICEAWHCLESDYNVSGILQERASNRRRNMSCRFQLLRMRFDARPNLCTETLTPNGRAIYEHARRMLKLPAGD